MELSCTFGNETWYYPSRQVIYTCRMKAAMITEPGTVIKSVNGAHQAGKGDNDVGVIYFESTRVEHFPKGLNKIFPNITHLTIHFCGLKEIYRRDLVGFKTLICLDLYHNKIESLSDDLFVGMENLQCIFFQSNKISCASSKLLEPIEPQLKFAWFGGNAKINVNYHNLTPETLNELKQHLDKCDKPKNSLRCSVVEFPEFYAEKLKLMWTTGKFSDFTIIVDKKEFKVHKNVLGSQSDFFETMFEQEMEESLTGKMTIDVFKPEPVEEFLKFFYTGEAPSVANAIEVFKLAAMYDVPKLADLCEDVIIIDNVDKSNVIEVMQLAKVHERDEMKVCAVKVFKSIFPEGDFEDSVFDDCEMLAKIMEAKNFIDSKFKA